MKILITLFFLIKINYPSNDLEEIRYINRVVDLALKDYCYLGIEYDITFDDTQADLTITPCVRFLDFNTLGTTQGTVHLNKGLYGVPEIRLADIRNEYLLRQVMVHEFGHFLGYVEHSIDSESVYYWSLYNYDIQRMTRYDTLKLFNLLNFSR